MFDYLLSDNGIELDTNEVELIKDLIRGTPRKSNRKKFLYEIVANERCGVDVDKVGRLNNNTCLTAKFYSLIIFNEIVSIWV